MEWLGFTVQYCVFPLKRNPKRSTAPAAMQPQLCSPMEPCFSEMFLGHPMEKKHHILLLMVQNSHTTTWDGAKTLKIMG